MSTIDRRTVHGLSDSGGWEVVRYNRAGKWYLETKDQRIHVLIRHAARIAAHGTFHPGLPGGKAFDAHVRAIRAKKDA